MADKAAKGHSAMWLRNLLAGDEAAFADFVDRYKEMVFLCCRTLGLRDDEAEEVASETFLAAYKNLSLYRGQAKLSSWLWRIAYCQAISFLRKNRRMEPLLEEPEQLSGSAIPEPAAALQGVEKEEIVWQTVKRLPKLWAMTVILFYREDKSIKEIAKIMQTRQNTIKTYLFRGRKMLKEMLPSAMGEDINAG